VHLLLATLLLLLSAVPAAASEPPVNLVLPVFHGGEEVRIGLVTPGSDGHQLGDLRTLEALPVADAEGAVIGRIDAWWVTTSVDFPGPGDEVRMGVLNFVFDDGEHGGGVGSADQVVVSGSGFYPGKESTIALGAILDRPIVGGSGVYAGATGWAESEHLADGRWLHTLHLILPSDLP